MEVIKRIKSLRHKFYIWLYHRYPIQQNKIITWNSVFRGYGDNTKYLVEYLCANKPGKYDIVWVYDRLKGPPKDLPDCVRAVPYFSIDYLKEISTAKIIISNIRIGPLFYFNKRKGQFYIQTWHSSVRLKKIEGDAAETLGEDYIEHAKEDSSKCDLIISGCDFSTNIFANSFWYDGKILKCGTPRCDILLDNSCKAFDKVRTFYGLNTETQIVLYAPTFRDNCDDELHGIPAAELITALQKHFGSNWVFLYRLHPNLEKTVESPMKDAINATSYPDMQELIAASQMLITDYSSCMFDMAFCNKPCILYAPDFDEYVAKERGLYFDIMKFPFPVAKSGSELVFCITSFDAAKYQGELNMFMQQLGSYEDGHACERVAEVIEEVCFKEMKK